MDIINKLSEIKEGWGNIIFPTPEIELIAIKRAEICATCEHNKVNICTQCGCFIPAKTRSLKANCPINKWNLINKQ